MFKKVKKWNNINGGIKMNKDLRKTKIVGTIGPASEKKLKELFEAGLNATRINYSHGNWEDQKEKLN